MSDNESAPESESHDVETPAGDEQVQSTGSKHPLLIYTLARTLLLAGSLAAVYLVGARGILWIVIGFVVSALLSYLLLGKLRDQISAGVGNHFDKMNERVEEGDSTLADELRPADELPVADKQSDRE